MSWNKDIRYPEKKVDASWKEEVDRNKSVPNGQSASSEKKSSRAAPEQSSKKEPVETSKLFVNLLTSLGYQTLFQLGEMPDPMTGQKEINLEAAQETINLLQMLQEKTEGNRSSEEDAMLKQLLSELQLKFAEKV